MCPRDDSLLSALGAAGAPGALSCGRFVLPPERRLAFRTDSVEGGSLKSELAGRLRSDRALFDWIERHCVDGFWYLDLGGRLKSWVSPRFRALLGDDDADPVAERIDWQDLVVEEELPSLLRAIERHVTEGADLDRIVHYRHRDGSSRAVRCRGFVLCDAQGRANRLLCAHSDVTGWVHREFGPVDGDLEFERVAAELEVTRRARDSAESDLQVTRERYAMAVDAAEVGVWNLDLASGVLHWNDRCALLLAGYRHGVPEGAALTYASFEETLHPDDLEATTQAVNEAIEAGTRYHVEYRVVWPDGSVHWIEARGAAVYDASGEPRRLEGVVIDIGRRKATEAALRLSEERLRRAQEVGRIGACEWDLETRVGVANPLFFEIIGLELRPDSRVLLDEFLTSLLPTDRESLDSEIDRVAGMGGQVRCEYRLRRSIGRQRWIAVNLAVVERNDSRILVGAFRDVTDQRAAADVQARLTDELETMLHISAHDLREPLRAVRSFSHLTLQRYGEQLDHRGREYLGRIARGVERMDQLLDDLTSVGKAQRIDPSKAPLLELSRVVQGALARLDHRVGESGATVRIEGPLPTVRADEFWTTQAIYNLLGNALKFTIQGERPEISVGSYSDEDQIGLVVRDRGPGVDPAQADRVFELFQRGVGRDVEGTGAGLAIVRRVARSLGGDSWVEPRPGGGAQFYLTFARLPERIGLPEI